MKSAEILDHDNLYPNLTNGERISQTHYVNGPTFQRKMNRCCRQTYFPDKNMKQYSYVSYLRGGGFP
jgi:hypothetical protein